MERLTESVADVGAWFIAEGESDGLPTLIRGRTGLGELRGHASLGKRLTVVWQMQDFTELGMPTDVESERMRECENALCEAIEEEGLGILTLAFTHDSRREWSFYVSDIEAVGASINDALPHDPPLPIELSMTEDPGWSEYEAMMQGTGQNDEADRESDA